MNRSIVRTVALFYLVTTCASFAQLTENPTNVRNAGAIPCAEYQAIVRADGRQLEKTAFLNWAAAYATAVSRSNGVIDVFPIADTWELLQFTSQVCVENPNRTFEHALQEVLNRTRILWVTTSPAVLNLQDPTGRNVQIYSEVVEPLQRLLNSFGANLQVDGVYGQQTGNAVSRFNQLIGTTPLMVPDGNLLYQLTIPR